MERTLWTHFFLLEKHSLHEVCSGYATDSHSVLYFCWDSAFFCKTTPDVRCSVLRKAQKGVRRSYGECAKQDDDKPSGFSQILSLVVGLYQYVQSSGFPYSVRSKETSARCCAMWGGGCTSTVGKRKASRKFPTPDRSRFISQLKPSETQGQFVKYKLSAGQ